jgi:uncharacterized protein (TIGR04376 family)
MKAFEDMNRFLEERLDEFLKSHPDLELRILEDQLREQKDETQKNLRKLASDEKQIQQNILKTAQEVQRWNERIEKAEQAKRPDLAQAAKEREAALLRQGNQQWAQMSLIQEQIQQANQRAEQIEQRIKDVQVKIREAPPKPPRTPTPQAWQSTPKDQAWSSNGLFSEPDPLEEQFKTWEMEAELEALKRKLGQ